MQDATAAVVQDAIEVEAQAATRPAARVWIVAAVQDAIRPAALGAIEA